MEKRIISIEIPNELRTKLRTEAFKQDITISALIRNILNNYFDNNITHINHYTGRLMTEEEAKLQGKTGDCYIDDNGVCIMLCKHEDKGNK